MEVQFTFGPDMEPCMDSGVFEETNDAWEQLPKGTPLMMDIPGLGRRIVEIPEYYEILD